MLSFFDFPISSHRLLLLLKTWDRRKIGGTKEEHHREVADRARGRPSDSLDRKRLEKKTGTCGGKKRSTCQMGKGLTTNGKKGIIESRIEIWRRHFFVLFTKKPRRNVKKSQMCQTTPHTRACVCVPPSLSRSLCLPLFSRSTTISREHRGLNVAKFFFSFFFLDLLRQ